jgi:putative chitinase
LGDLEGKAMMMFNRKIFFDAVRGPLFHGTMTQRQVDGMSAILSAWENNPRSDNLRWVSYPLATTAHETGFAMWPIEEHKGAQQSYGKEDPETKQCYYGRGFVQLTHRENYARADKELNYGSSAESEFSLEWHAANALDLDAASEVMFQGMDEGWFRKDDKGPHNLARYFSESVDDSYNARDIINGDKKTVPTWSGGVSIGNLIKGYNIHFLAALEAAFTETPDDPDMVATYLKTITVASSAPVSVVVEDE